MSDITIGLERGEYVEYITYEAVKAIGFIPVDIMLEHLKYEKPDVRVHKEVITYHNSVHMVKVTIPWSRITYTALPWTVS